MQSKLPKECREPTGYEKISGTLKTKHYKTFPKGPKCEFYLILIVSLKDVYIYTGKIMAKLIYHGIDAEV